MPKHGHHPNSQLNLSKGRGWKNRAFFRRGWQRPGHIDLKDFGVEDRSHGHAVHRDTDIGQHWMRQQAALDYSYEMWFKLLAPVETVVKEERLDR